PGRAAASLARPQTRDAHRLGVKRLPVVKGHVPSQREAEPYVIEALPLCREFSLNDLGLRNGHQSLEDVVEKFPARLLGADERVEAAALLVRAGHAIEGRRGRRPRTEPDRLTAGGIRRPTQGS